MSDTTALEKKQRWYNKIPNALVIIFAILVLMAILTWIIPSGVYDREILPNGREGVIAGSYHQIEKTDQMKVGFFDVFRAVPQGLVAAGSVVFVIFLAGGMFKVLDKTGAIENGIGIMIRTIERRKISKYVGLALVTAVFGFFGVAIGFENLIAFVPVGIMVVLGLGFDLMTAASAVVGGLAVGFGTSPINAYTVGVAHEIADLPTFSGMGLRSIFCLVCLTILYLYMVSYSKKVDKDPSKSLDLHGRPPNRQGKPRQIRPGHPWDRAFAPASVLCGRDYLGRSGSPVVPDRNFGFICPLRDHFRCGR